LDAMTSIHEHFRFNNRNEPLLLAQGCIATERMRIRFDAGLARQSIRDTDDGAPFGKARADGAVLLQAVPQSVQTFGDSLSVKATKLAPKSTLMPGMTPCRTRRSESGTPSEAFWRIVSSCMITLLIKFAASGVVKSNSR